MIENIQFRVRDPKTGKTEEFYANSPEDYCQKLSDIYKIWDAPTVIDCKKTGEWVEEPKEEEIAFNDLPKDVQEQIKKDFAEH